MILILLALCHVFGGLPDLTCTPGRINPLLTRTVICSKQFRTSSYRDKTTSSNQKATVYESYGISRPSSNRGRKQKCELDHLIPLELGGADTLDNIWPQCSKGYASWKGPGFRDKDKVENRLRKLVCQGKVSLTRAQQAIASDWIEAGGLNAK